MDGVHDLGGKQGFGPVAVTDGDAQFQHDWERRMWGMARAGILTNLTIDWFRHGLERMVPADYLSNRYFDKWCANYMMIYVDNGQMTLGEVLAGHVEAPGEPAPVKTLDEVLAANRGGHISFEVPAGSAPKFAVGDRVLTRRIMPVNHTRLPAYARNATGTVIARHGSHALPDKGALGIHEGEHLYTVSFSAQELWGGDADPRDTVMLELWESYFVPAG